MNLINKISSIYHRIIAKQLRSPSGLLANYVGNTMNRSNELLYQLTLNNLHVKDGDSILEIGFGNGKFFSDLNSIASNLTIMGIDHSQEMVNEAIKNNKDLYDSGTIKVSVGSSEYLPYESNSIDKIFCVNVIYFWENPVLHLKEIFRVLKPGGYFCTGFRPKENLSKFSFSQFGFTLYTEQEWKSLIEENGFRFVSSENGKDLEIKMHQKNTPFESLCIVGIKE